MSSAFVWYKAKQMLNLDGEDWPECLIIPKIAKLHFSNDKQSVDVLQKMLDDAVISGELEMSNLIVSKPANGFAKTARVVFGSDNRDIGRQIRESFRPDEVSDVWIDFFKPLEAGEQKLYPSVDNPRYRAELKSKYNNGWPKEWKLIAEYDSQESHDYIASPTISKSNYAAWANRPEIPKDSLLNCWLAKNERQTEAVGDVGVGIHGETEPASAKVSGVFSGVKDLRANKISFLMLKGGKTAKMVINGKTIEVHPCDLGLKHKSQGWKLLESAAVNNGELTNGLKMLNKTSNLPSEKNNISTAISRLNKKLMQKMGLQNHLIVLDGCYKFTFKVMAHEEIHGRNVTPDDDCTDYCTSKGLDENQYEYSSFSDEFAKGDY